jgi:hypothetical protein
MLSERKVAMMVTVAIISMSLAACGVLGGTPTGTGQNVGPVSSSAAAQRAPVVIHAGVCIDGTGSSPGPFAVQMTSLMADSVAAWDPPPPDPASGASAQPGLTFAVRPIVTSSYATNVLTLTGSIPAVPALAAEPQADSDPSFDNDIHSWMGAKAAWEREESAASAAAASLSGRIRQFPPVRNTWSAIYACIGALAAQVLAHGPSTRLIVASDMENNESVVGLNLAGDAVMIVESCPPQVSTTCPSRFAGAKAFLMQHGASSVQLIRSDAVTPAIIDDFLEGGS